MNAPQLRTDGEATVAAPRVRGDVTKGDWLLGEFRRMATAMMPGELFPSDRALAERFQVARMTVRGQLDTLVDQGLLKRVPGRGTFVQRPEALISDHTPSLSFTTEMRARGLRPSARILSFRRTSPNASDRQIFGSGAHDVSINIVRVRYADGAPMSLERVKLPASRTPGLTRARLEGRSLHELLSKEYAITAVSAEQTVALARPRAADLAWLDLPEGSPVLRLDRVTRDADGRAIEHARSFYHPDRYQIHMHVGRTG